MIVSVPGPNVVRRTTLSPTPLRRRHPARTIGIGLALIALTVLVGPLRLGRGGPGRHPAQRARADRPATPRVTVSTTTTTSPTQRVPPGPPSDQRRLTLLATIGGAISPKSVVASGTGLVFAQNMMYTHTVTVYDSAGNLVRTIPDRVDLAQFGIPGHAGVTRGAPVEAAFSPDARYAYVTNYSMYGTGFGPEGSDSCTPSSARAAGDTDSFVYRIDTQTFSIDQVIEVGLVPKYVAVAPDDRYLLVTNWCSFDLSVVDVARGREIARLPMGTNPRGIAVTPDSSTAYVAIMGGSQLVRVDLRTLSRAGSVTVGPNPRHVVLDPTGRYLYVSLNASGTLVKYDLVAGQVVGSVRTGLEERSLAIAADGLALYVVNYGSNTVSKVRAADLTVLQTVATGTHPIGITYDRVTGDVWVAIYTGKILVLADR